MFIIDNQVYIRLVFFFGVLIFMAVWEINAPRRTLTGPKIGRWVTNLSITFLNAFLVRLLFPAAAVGAAFFARERGFGLLTVFRVEAVAAGFLSIVVLDLAIYLQHVYFHRSAFFWRFHMAHHTDLDIDVTTGARFHPIEIALSMLIKMGIVVLLGAPAWSVLVFEVVLNGTSMFNHSNIFIPTAADRVLRRLVVTPDMHRVHHSVIIAETNSNYGFNFPFWDRVFGTYRDQPAAGHEGMVIGLANFRDPLKLKLFDILALPVRGMRG